MPVQILSTKLSIPAVRSRLVLRHRLLQKLNQGLDSGFLLVSAPAGYGKSTLLSMWANRLENPVAWLSLDARDNDPSRFFTYLSSALRNVYPSMDQAYELPSDVSSTLDIEGWLTALINSLSPLKQPICLVLDDYHVIQNQAIHQAISFLLDHRPPHLHLVIATRADPPLPLAKLRARSCLSELRMTDLRFTIQEAADFLNHTMGLNVSPQDVDHLNQRTEGWIAGLQMAALSMQNSEDIPAFIASLSASQYYIFDYLLEEILQKQSPEIQRFLLYTSILDQLTGSLCDTLLAGDSYNIVSRPADIILHELEHANLFIIPLDYEQHWYRYHPLFAELLRGYLQKSDPLLVTKLHTCASHWFEAQGLVADAIRHSLAIGDWEHTVNLISTNIFALLEQKELNSVARQLETLTGEANPARPWLMIGRAWLAAYTGQLSTVEPLLVKAETQIDSLQTESELQKLCGHIATIRAYINWIGDRRDIASQAARTALEWLPAKEYLIRCQALTLLGLILPSFDEREQALNLALVYAKECSVSHVTIFAYSCWAWQFVMRGKLHEAQAACQEAITHAQVNPSYQPLPTLSHVYATLSTVLYVWNDLEPALRYAKEAVELARRWGQADALHFALDTLGYALFASGDIERAFEASHQAWQVACRTSKWFEEITISQEVEWYIALHKLDEAVSRLHEAHMDSTEAVMRSLGSFRTSLLPFSFIQVLLAQKDFSTAVRLIPLLIEELKSRQVGYYLVRLYLWQALAYQGLHQHPLALSSLEEAFVVAAPQGYVTTFIQEGSEMRALLLRARAAGIQPAYIDTLLAAFDSPTKAHPADKRLSSDLIEPLSSRELDVLKLLSQGCSDKKIAESLVIARETVHKHLKNIYGKLDVHSRTEAIARARDLSLL